jgi:hypothetical protein
MTKKILAKSQAYSKRLDLEMSGTLLISIMSIFSFPSLRQTKNSAKEQHIIWKIFISGLS